jgi:hypothetical protein
MRDLSMTCLFGSLANVRQHPLKRAPGVWVQSWVEKSSFVG